MKKRLFRRVGRHNSSYSCFRPCVVSATPYAKTYSAEHVSQSKKQIALTFDDGPGKAHAAA